MFGYAKYCACRAHNEYREYREYSACSEYNESSEYSEYSAYSGAPCQGTTGDPRPNGASHDEAEARTGCLADDTHGHSRPEGEEEASEPCREKARSATSLWRGLTAVPQPLGAS